MEKPKKILITTGIFPPDIGGPATMIIPLADALAEAGWRATVLTYGAPAKSQRQFKLRSVAKKWPAPLRHFFYLLKTFWLARRADIIYTTDLYSPGYYSLLAAKFWRKKLVARFAGDSAWETAFNFGLVWDDILTFQEKIYSRQIEKLKTRPRQILRSADKVIAVSNFMKNLAEVMGAVSEKITVVYNAVDPLINAPTRQKPVVPTLVFAGRLVPWKGVVALISVVAKLKPRYPNIIFEILGDGPEENKLKAESEKLKVEENIIFRGRVSEEESHRIFARATIFVLNTFYEGLSHAILHAMTVGLPIITTPVGGNPELVQDGVSGLLAPYNDEAAWQAAIEKLLSDEALQEKLVANAKENLKKFKWEEMVMKTVEVLNNLF